MTAGGKTPRNKGKNGERELTKIFMNVFGGSFQRVIGSGAFVGGFNSFRKSHLTEIQKRSSKGDIITDDVLPKLVIEVKNYAEFPFHQLIIGECPLLEKWIEQQMIAIDEGDVWVVCFKIAHKGWFICYDKKLELINNNYAVFKTYVVSELISCLTNNKELLIKLCN